MSFHCVWFFENHDTCHSLSEIIEKTIWCSRRKSVSRRRWRNVALNWAWKFSIRYINLRDFRDTSVSRIYNRLIVLLWWKYTWLINHDSILLCENRAFQESHLLTMSQSDRWVTQSFSTNDPTKEWEAFFINEKQFLTLSSMFLVACGIRILNFFFTSWSFTKSEYL